MVKNKAQKNSQSTVEEEFDFSKLIKTKLERRVMDHFEAVTKNLDANMEEAITAQATMITHSLAAVTKMYEAGGYVNTRGVFVSLGPRDLLFLQQAIDSSLRLRSDLLMIPMGLEATANFMKLAKDMSDKGSAADPNTGLAEPPPLRAIDGEEDGDNIEDNEVQEEKNSFSKINKSTPKPLTIELKTVDTE